MQAGQQIKIGSRVYYKNPEVDRYQVHLNELENFPMGQIPPHSHVEVLGLPEPHGLSSMECYGLNDGQELSVYGGPSILFPQGDRARIVARLHRAFPYSDPDERGHIRNPTISLSVVDDGILAHVFLNYIFSDKPATTLREAVSPFVDGNRRLDQPSVRVFICHASEDKPAARALANAMKGLGADVWFDEWEIRVGESIVQRIGDALGTISHLVVLLSLNSVEKPWVRKELSSALMRQLSQQSVTVLPVRLDNCSVPPLLADIKYADARNGVETALAELEKSLFDTFKFHEVA